MAAENNRIDPKLTKSPEQFSRVLDSLASERSLAEAIVIRRDGKVLARTKLSFLLTFDSMPNNLLNQASRGEVVVITRPDSDRAIG